MRGAFTAPVGLEPAFPPWRVRTSKDGAELEAGVHKNKHADLESSARSRGCVNITPTRRLVVGGDAADQRPGSKMLCGSPAFQRVEGVQCYLPAPGSLTNSRLKAP